MSIVPSLFSGTVQLKKSSEEILVCPHVEYLEDKKGSLTIDDVQNSKYDKQWIPSDRKTLGFGYTDSVYWFRFNVRNRSIFDIEYLLEYSFPTVDEIKIYIYDNGNLRVMETGDKKPFSQRGFDYRNFVLSLKSKAKTSTSFYFSQATSSSLITEFRIWSPEAFRKMKLVEYSMLAMFCGIILIMIIYNFVIFIYLRRIDYLYYVLFITSFLLFVITINGTAFQFLWPDSPEWANLCLYLSIVMMGIFIGLFATELVELRTVREGIPYRQVLFKIVVILYIVSIIFIVIILLSSFRYRNQIATYGMAIVLCYITVASVILIVKEKNRPAIIGLSAGMSMMLGSLAFMLMILGILPVNFMTEWSLHIGSVFMVALFSYALADRINSMTMVIMKAEKKYRELVESSDDIIFSLDEKMNFLSVSMAVKKHLGYYEENIIGKNFLDFIHDSGKISKHITREVIEGYIHDLKESKKGVTFKTDLKKRDTDEPVELSVKLEYAESDDKKEKILGKASSLADNTLLQYMKMEKNIFEVENYLNNAEILSQRLTQNLYKFIDRSEIPKIRLSLREILINAIEHGNLDIDFEGKSNALNEGNYIKYIMDRQKDSRYRDRKFYVDYYLTEENVTYIISDEGNGFDHQNLEDLISKKSSEEFLGHGRGIRLVRNTFDEVEFNEKGNQVTLMKSFKQ